MAWFINQSLLIVLAAFLLGLLVGWLFWGTRKSSPQTSAARPAEGAGMSAATTPTPHAAPRRSYRLAGTRIGRRAAEGHSVQPAVKGGGDQATVSRRPHRVTKTAAKAAVKVEHAARKADIAVTPIQSATTKAEPVVTKSEPVVTKSEPVAVEATPITTGAESVETRHDELERIEGIGPKMADALRAAGIHTFGQLAEADDDTRRAAIEKAGLTFAPSLVTWGRQAQLLADGDEEGFAELTELLVAGRDTGRA
ncbi:helix-hairpin-helix domain-containing protein [Micromonospora sp. CPCC 205539]|uniref:helix-hairpin-helix domain-containing protein n=1 Tax=Micromonospora sp. CPCC 205539 TaxID=3122408 RepID=UPI002FEFB0D0